MTTISKMLGKKLRDPENRKAFVASQISVGLPFQLRALLKARGKTQEWLAAKTGMLQPRISGLLNPGKTRPNIETLRRLAEAFDCGLAVRFVPFSELAGWSEAFDPESFEVPSFDKELEQCAFEEFGSLLDDIHQLDRQPLQKRQFADDDLELSEFKEDPASRLVLISREGSKRVNTTPTGSNGKIFRVEGVPENSTVAQDHTGRSREAADGCDSGRLKDGRLMAKSATANFTERIA